MPDPGMAEFVTLSSALTGIDGAMLAPGIDPTNIKQAYFDTAQQADPTLFATLLGIVAANPTLPPDQLATLVLVNSGEPIRFFARSIMLAWYLGSWYNPDDLKRYAVPKPPEIPIPFRVISMDAYTNGWAWSVAQAHPMGYSTMTFGYWGAPPPSLADYIEAGE
jgi:hypothetical protein